MQTQSTKEPFKARIPGQEEPIILSVRETRAMKQFKALKLQHPQISLIPPKVHRERFVKEQSRRG
jgi:hypothetical protein